MWVEVGRKKKFMQRIGKKTLRGTRARDYQEYYPNALLSLYRLCLTSVRKQPDYGMGNEI